MKWTTTNSSTMVLKDLQHVVWRTGHLSILFIFLLLPGPLYLRLGAAKEIGSSSTSTYRTDEVPVELTRASTHSSSNKAIALTDADISTSEYHSILKGNTGIEAHMTDRAGLSNAHQHMNDISSKHLDTKTSIYTTTPEVHAAAVDFHNSDSKSDSKPHTHQPYLLKSSTREASEPGSQVTEPGSTLPIELSTLAAAEAAWKMPQSDQALDDPIQEDGFSLFFKTNPAEMMNVPITFSNPLPSWMNGTLVRNGLGKFENGPRKFLHAFDGFAKLASWRFTGNETAFFSTRFIRSGFYKESKRTKTIAPYLLFQAVTPPFSYYEQLQSLYRGIDNMNVNIYAFRNPKNKKVEYAALSDFWIIYKVSIKKLSTKHKVVPRIKKGHHSVATMGGLGFLNLLSSAHPLPEPETNNHLNFLSSVSFVPWGDHMMKLVRFKSLKRRRVIAQWPVERVPYMHSFSVTRTKAILLASPFYVNVGCMASKAQPFSCLDWNPEEPAKLYVVDLKSGNLTTITMETVFSMHHVNAYEVSGTKIIMDVSTYPNPDFVSHLQLQVLMDPVARNSFDAHAKLQRITIDLAKREAHLSPVDPRPVPHLASLLDMPVINEAYRSRRYCYVYGLVLKADNMTLSNIAIVKKDLCNPDGLGGGKGDKLWVLPDSYPVEPWFVANPRAAAEDDGLLLIPVIDGVKKVSTMVVLDAKTMTTVSSAILPTIIPYSLHGRFFEDV